MAMCSMTLSTGKSTRQTHNTHRMISHIPQSVPDQHVEEWAAACIRKEHTDVALARTPTNEAANEPNSELSCVSEADSNTTRSYILKKPTCIMSLEQMQQLCAIQQNAQNARVDNPQRNTPTENTQRIYKSWRLIFRRALAHVQSKLEG